MISEYAARFRDPVTHQNQWEAAMAEFTARRQELIDSNQFSLVYTNGYVTLKNGDVVWHATVSVDSCCLCICHTQRRGEANHHSQHCLCRGASAALGATVITVFD